MDIYCVGRNFVGHAKELGNAAPTKPIIFLKSSSSVRDLSPISMAFDTDSYDFEAEIVLKVARNYKFGQSPGINAISAFTLGLDLTRRSVQNDLKSRGLPWTLAKSFKGSSIVCDFIDLPSDYEDKLAFNLFVENTLKQQGHPKDMTFDFSEIVNHILSFDDLNEGDLIFTGTPKGVGKIKKGMSFCLELPKLDIKFKGKI